MVSCSALSCRNATSGVHKNSSVSFYSFPLQNQPLLRQWLQNMGRGFWTPSKYQCLCSEHFEESSFEVGPVKIRKKRRLLKEAAPSKFLRGLDGSWHVGTPQDFIEGISNKSQKRSQNPEPCRVPGIFPQWPRLQDWQNEFYKQLLKEKYGSLITLGKDFPVPQSHVPAGGAAQVRDPRDLKGKKTPASLSTGHSGALIQAQAQGSSSGASQSPQQHSPEQTEPSGSRPHPAPNPAGMRSGNRVPAGQELDAFRQFLLDHQGQPEEAKVPWFICTQCGRSFARHSHLVQHQRGHAGLRPLPRRSRAGPASPPCPQPALPTAGGLAYPVCVTLEFGEKVLSPK